MPQTQKDLKLKKLKISAIVSLVFGIVSIFGIVLYNFGFPNIRHVSELKLNNTWKIPEIFILFFGLFILATLLNLLFQFRIFKRISNPKYGPQESSYSDDNNARNFGVPLSNSYWVLPGKLLAGGYPGSENLDLARKNQKSLLEAGIRHVISFMESDEVNWDGKPVAPYEDLMTGIANAMGITVTIHRMPIKDMSVPSEIHMNLILDLIDLFVQNKQSVFIHCWAGRGRTGTVVGCYLLRHGHASKLNLLQAIENFRKETQGHDNPSPVTPEQINFVISWPENG